MFNNVTYQAATDGRAFKLIPLILISLVRSSTARLLVHLRHWHQHRPIIATNVAPGCIGWNTPTSVPVLVCPTCQRTYLLSSFVVGGGVEPPAHLRFFRESPPLWSDAVALVSVGGPHPLIPILPVCANYPGFYLPYYVLS